MYLLEAWKKTGWANSKSEPRSSLVISFIMLYLLKLQISYPFTGWTARHWGLSIPWMTEVFNEPSKCATLICVSSNSELIQYKLRDIQSTARPLILWISARSENSCYFDFLFIDYWVIVKKPNFFYSLLKKLCNIISRCIYRLVVKN